MKTLFRFTLLLLCFQAAAPWPLDAGPAVAVLPATPTSLAVPAGQELSLTLKAKGVQIYECRPTQSDPAKFEWAFKAPEADLFDAAGSKVGRHYAGPTWEVTGGGKVVGHLKAKADAPDGKGVAWLLLEAVPGNPGGGDVMGRVQSIQRVGTVGGKPPAETADQSKVGQERRVDYTATYLFFTTQP